MKIVEIIAEAGSADTIAALAEKFKTQEFHQGITDAEGMQLTRLLVNDEKVQSVLDTLQTLLGAQPYARILVIPVEAALPHPTEEDKQEHHRKDADITSREAIYESVEKNVKLDSNFILLVILSTIVAAIGLVKNNIAVVIGAMVIAPLLAPNLALGLATALGDLALMRKSIVATVAGLGLSVILTGLIGLFLPLTLNSPELLSRTEVGLDSVALALASGAAAALSLTTGLSSTLVGVMVAVALLPPASALGLMLGQGNLHLAMGAGLLLAVNIAAVNLASNIVFIAKGIHPRSWREKQMANRATAIYVLVWLSVLILLVLAIYQRHAAS